jgi:hypothetical protein
MRTRSFSDDQKVVTTDGGSEPEYEFDGFNVEFSVKVALTPPTLAKPSDPKPRQGAR